MCLKCGLIIKSESLLWRRNHYTFCIFTWWKRNICFQHQPGQKRKKKPIQNVPCCRSETLTSYSHFTTLNVLHLRTETYSQHAVYSCDWFWRQVLSWTLCLGAEAARLSNYPTLNVTIKTYLWKPSQIQVEAAHKDIPANPQQHPQQVLRRQKVHWLQRKWSLPRGRSEALRCSFLLTNALNLTWAEWFTRQIWDIARP